MNYKGESIMSSIIYFLKALNELKQLRENFHKLSCPHPRTCLPQGSVFSLPSPMFMHLSYHSKEHHPLLHLRVHPFCPSRELSQEFSLFYPTSTIFLFF